VRRRRQVRPLAVVGERPGDGRRPVPYQQPAQRHVGIDVIRLARPRRQDPHRHRAVGGLGPPDLAGRRLGDEVEPPGGPPEPVQEPADGCGVEIA